MGIKDLGNKAGRMAAGLLGMGIVGGIGAFVATEVRDPMDMPKQYQAITPQEIQYNNHELVEISMSPVHINPKDNSFKLRKGDVYLEASLSRIEGGFSNLRKDNGWNLWHKEGVLDSITDLVLSKGKTPVTLRGLLEDNTLKTYSVTIGATTYSLDGKEFGEVNYTSDQTSINN